MSDDRNAAPTPIGAVAPPGPPTRAEAEDRARRARYATMLAAWERGGVRAPTDPAFVAELARYPRGQAVVEARAEDAFAADGRVTGWATDEERARREARRAQERAARWARDDAAVEATEGTGDPEDVPPVTVTSLDDAARLFGRGSRAYDLAAAALRESGGAPGVVDGRPLVARVLADVERLFDDAPTPDDGALAGMDPTAPRVRYRDVAPEPEPPAPPKPRPLRCPDRLARALACLDDVGDGDVAALVEALASRGLWESWEVGGGRFDVRASVARVRARMPPRNADLGGSRADDGFYVTISLDRTGPRNVALLDLLRGETRRTLAIPTPGSADDSDDARFSAEGALDALALAWPEPRHAADTVALASLDPATVAAAEQLAVAMFREMWARWPAGEAPPHARVSWGVGVADADSRALGTGLPPDSAAARLTEMGVAVAWVDDATGDVVLVAPALP